MASEKEDVGAVLNAIADLYTDSLQKHGPTAPAVGMKDGESQLLRFEKLLQVVDVDASSRPLSFNDYGCGYGSLFVLLRERLGDRLGYYYGYDISEEMLAEAKRSIDDPRAEFILGSTLTHSADYSILSGTLNVKLDATDEAWGAYVRSIVLQLAARSTAGFAFNLLTSYVDWRAEQLYYADPMVLFDFCKRHVSRYVSLLHDYPLFEWTMLVRLEGEKPG